MIERRKRDVHTRYRPKREVHGCHYYGVVHGQPNSRVAVSTCNGLVRKYNIHFHDIFIKIVL